MAYRVKRNQILRKKLPVPKEIQEKVYDRNLKLEDYIKYDLADKIPVEHLYWEDREIVSKFGAEKLKQLDMEMYRKNAFKYSSILLKISPDVSDLNLAFYQSIMDHSTGKIGYKFTLRPEDVTPSLLEKMSHYFVEDIDISVDLKEKFYNGELTILDLVSNWHIFKDKVVDGKLEYYSQDVDLEQLRKLMNEYPDIASIITYNDTFSSLMTKLYGSATTKEQREDIVVEFCIDTLNDDVVVKDEEIFDVIYTYVEPEEYLHERMDYLRFNKYASLESYSHDFDKFAQGLDGMSVRDVVNAGFTMEVLLDDNVLDFVNLYGIKNIVEFDRECGNFFSRNNFEMLRLMQPMYMHYAGNNHDPNTTFFTRNWEEYDRPYNKEEFYEAIRRMIIGGPTDWNYKGRGTDYRYITGLFRELNPDLFVSDKLPEHIQEAFYTKQLTPQMIIDNQEIIPELEGKNLASCFKYLNLTTTNEEHIYDEYNNVYSFLEKKFGFEKTMDFIVNYGVMAEIVLGSYDRYIKVGNIDSFKMDENTSYDGFIDLLIEKGRELLIKTRIKYDQTTFAPVREKYPNLFISESAPQELQDMFYNRELKLEIIEQHPEYIQYIQDIDLELLYRYMEVDVEKIVDGSVVQTRDNLMNSIRDIFGEQAFGVILLYGNYLEKIYDYNSLRGVVIGADFSADDLIDTLDNCLYNGLISGVIEHEEKMPTHFKQNYPKLFLPENTPQDIKDRFYKKQFNVNEFINNPELLAYFSETDIIYGLGVSFKSMFGLFDNETFLQIITLCGEEIKNENELFQFVHNNAAGNITVGDFSEFVYSYIKLGNTNLKYIILLDKLGYSTEEFDVMITKVKMLIEHRPETDFNNPALSMDLLSDDIVEKYGYDFISGILEYNSGAHKVVIDNADDQIFETWVSYVMNLPIYNKKLLHFAILSYPNSKELVEELVTATNGLNEQQLQNLYEVLVQRNKYQVYDVETLANYVVHRELYLENKITQSDDILVVKDGILEVLFNIELNDAFRIFKVYGLNSKEFINTLILDGVIDVEEQASIEIIREILDEKDIVKLREKFDNSIKRGSIVSFVELEQKLKLYFGKTFKDSLFKTDGVDKPGISHHEVDGLQDTRLVNIHGEEVTNDSKIKVVELEGIDFKLLIHKIHNYDPKFASLATRIISDPSLWNKLEGASTLSTSMVSNIHMECVSHGSSNAVYYGFNDISEQSLMLMGRSDIFVEHGGRKLEPTAHRNEFMIPDILQAVSISYNEVALDRKSSGHVEFDNRIQPTCIICFDGIINDDSKRAAQYFDIPIYVINRQKYREHNQALSDKYVNMSIDSMTTVDAKRILCSKIGSLEYKYQLFISLCDKALNENFITADEYVNVLKEGRKIISQFSTQNNIDGIDLSKITVRIEQVKEMGEMDYGTGKTI